MANSRYEYVRSYEKAELLLPATYIVVRIDGRGFHKYAIGDLKNDDTNLTAVYKTITQI